MQKDLRFCLSSLHTVWGGLRIAIFSFHMPLFFILSCVTFRFSQNGDEFVNKCEKAFQHLFLAAAGIYFLRTVIDIVRDVPMLIQYSFHDLKCYFANIINVFVAGSGVEVPISDLGRIDPIGIPWFLFALFFGRALFDYIHLRWKGRTFYIAISICTVLGLGFGRIQWLPFSIDIALAIQPLFLVGVWLKHHGIEKDTVKKLVISFFIWMGQVLLIYWTRGTFLELACRRYPLFPICYICAIAGTVFVSCCSQLLSGVKVISKPVMYLGKNSMVMLWVHCFDGSFGFVYGITKNAYINGTIRVIADIIAFGSVMMILNAVRNRNTNK